MKRFTLLLFLVIGLTAGCHAASPSFSSFYTNHFTTNGLVIKANLNPTQFDTNASSVTITITNIVGITGASLWTNIGGTLQPIEGDDVLVTNMVSRSDLVADGSFRISGIVSSNLVANTNQLNPYQVGTFRLTGPSTTASDTHISLSSGSGYQLLFIQNYATNSAFTFKNGQPLWDSPSQYVRLNGDWETTVFGDTLMLYNNGNWWSEVGRLWANTNVVSPVVINPSDNYLPVRESAGVFADSPLRVPSIGSSNAILNGSFTLGSGSDPTTVPLYVTTPTGHTNLTMRIDNGGTNYLTIDHKGQIAIGMTNLFLDKDISIARIVDREGSTSKAWINLAGADTWPTYTKASEWWCNAGQDDGVMAMAWRDGSGNQWDHTWTVGQNANFFYYVTKSNLVETFKLDGPSGDLVKIKSVPYLWPTANAAGTLLNNGSGTLTWGGSSITINPTDNYLPVRQSAGVFADSPLHVPSAGDTNVIANGALYVGPNSFGFWGASDYSIVSIHDIDQSEPNNNGIAIWTVSGNLNGAIDGNVTTNEAIFSIGVANGNIGSSIVWTGAQTNLFLDGQFGTNNPSVFRLHPTVEDLSANAAYTFDTPAWQLKTAADLARFKNAGTNMLSVGPTGQLIFGPGTTNVLARDGASLVVTNGATTNAFTLRNGLGTGFHMTFQPGGSPRLLSDNGFIWMGGTTVFEANLIPDSANTRSVGTMAAGGSFADSVFAGTHYVLGSNDSGANYTRLAINHTGNAGDIQYKSDALGTETFRPHVFQIGSTNVAKFDTTSAAGETRFWLYDEDNGTMERVTVGVPDSGGAGFKLLRIPN